MAITPPTTPVPTTVQSVTVVLKDWLEADEQTAGQSINYQLVLLDQNGQRIRWQHDQGNLAPHLTPEQITQAQSFMVAMRALAEAVIP
jgi:hypothetical protein